MKNLWSRGQGGSGIAPAPQILSEIEGKPAPLKAIILKLIYSKGTSMYYVSTKGGGRGSAKCLRLLTGGAKRSCLRNHSLEKNAE